jgi:integrase
MHSKPQIVNSNSIKTNVYVEFYLGNIRKRIYSGKLIGLRITPNSCTNVRERTTQLHLLCSKVSEALEAGFFNPAQEPEIVVNAETTLASALLQKKNSKLSDTYKRDLTYVYDQFLAFLTPEEKLKSLAEIPTSRITLFLEQFNTSNTYYMHKRTDLAVLFSTAGQILNTPIPSVKATSLKTPKAKLHVAYAKEQVKPLLEYLKTRHVYLYICCLLTYSAWLRPHVEILNLKKGDFDPDYSVIRLGGKDNKGGKVRVVYIPAYAVEVLKPILDKLTVNQNVFSGTEAAYNKDYFKTAWSRIRSRLFELNLIRANQTHYSFRHTAAVLMYRKTKDIYLLQKLLGHSSILVTQKYLRSLGEVNLEELRDAAPELD